MPANDIFHHITHYCYRYIAGMARSYSGFLLNLMAVTTRTLR
jgi:hypothetical protein